MAVSKAHAIGIYPRRSGALAVLGETLKVPRRRVADNATPHG